MNAPAIATPNAPVVTELDRIDDTTWFDDHPKRGFRARIDGAAQLWLIRRRGQNVYLPTPADPADHRPI